MANSSDVFLCAGEWSYAGHTLVSEFSCLVLFCGIPVLPCALMAPSFPLWNALQCVTTPQLSCLAVPLYYIDCSLERTVCVACAMTSILNTLRTFLSVSPALFIAITIVWTPEDF